MPITKQDVLGFGKTLKDSLTSIGEQIQYGRDVSNLQRIQKNVSNIKSFTTNKDGSPKSREEIAQGLFAIQTDINSTIRNPTILNLANTSVSQLVNEGLKGAMMEQDNQAELKGLEVTQPALFNKLQGAQTQFEPTLAKADYSKLKGAKLFAPKGVWRNNPDNPNKLDYVLPFTFTDGTYGGEQYVGSADRTDLNTQEKLQLEADKMANQLEEKRIPNRNINSSYSYSTGDRPTSFKDEGTGKVTNLMMRGNKLYNLDGTPVKPEDARKYANQTPITENVNPNSQNTKDIPISKKVDVLQKNILTQLGESEQRKVQQYWGGNTTIPDVWALWKLLPGLTKQQIDLIYDIKTNPNNEYLDKYFQ